MYGVPSLLLNVRGADASNDNETTIALSDGTGTAYANYTAGNGTSELLFAYTVGAGDATDRLDYSSPAADALLAPFGAIVAKDTTLGWPVYLWSLPEPGAEDSLGWNTDIVISDEVLLVERVSFRSACCWFPFSNICFHCHMCRVFLHRSTFFVLLASFLFFFVCSIFLVALTPRSNSISRTFSGFISRFVYSCPVP